jgi:transcriptional regulator with XRE-family HTH domain
MSEWPLDWRALVDEAVRRRKEEGLTQRSLAALAGVSVPTVNAFEQGEINLRFERIVAILDALGLFKLAARADDFQSFIHAARQRWKQLVEPLPEGEASRQPRGHSEQAYAIEELGNELPPLSKLREILAQAPKTSGWTPFWVPTKNSIRPTIQSGVIECWLGSPSADRHFTDAAHSDFWHISRDGRAYLQRGYQEDGADFDPGTIFDLTLPIVRTAEVLRHAVWLAHQLQPKGDVSIRFVGRYTGLAGRELFQWARPSLRDPFLERRIARADSVDLAIDAALSTIENNIAEMVHVVLTPLYERFDGYRLSYDLVHQTLKTQHL